MCQCLRWAFRLNTFEPTAEEWRKILDCIQLEEVHRLNQFYFREEVKSAAIGRLMLRRAAVAVTGKPWSAVRFHRTEKGRPVLRLTEHSGGTGLATNFNISHNGDFVVLAACTGYESECGVDVMKMDKRSNETIDDYLKLMKRQFSEHEFSTFSRFSTDREKLTLFFRYWCLKESYVKALGIGVHNNLASLSFHINSLNLSPNEITTTTKLILTNQNRHPECSDQSGKCADRRPDDFFQSDFDSDQQQSMTTYLFEESLLDADHVVAVCTRKNDRDLSLHQACYIHWKNPILFEHVDLTFLLEKSQPINFNLPLSGYSCYFEKKYRTK